MLADSTARKTCGSFLLEPFGRWRVFRHLAVVVSWTYHAKTLTDLVVSGVGGQSPRCFWVVDIN
jgi:hypothetical protein